MSIPLRYFKPEEFGEGWGRLNATLLYTLDDLRAYLDVQIIVNTDGIIGSRAKTPDSQHPLGRAVDLHAEGIALIDFWLAAERFPQFRGIGIYPFWKHPGLHLDVRDTRVRNRWWQDERGVYGSVTAKVLEMILMKGGEIT